MGLTHFVTVAAISLAGLLPASCHKTGATKSDSKPSAAAQTKTNAIAHDLGEVNLTNHNETCMHLGGGNDCTFLPKMLGGRSVQITLTFETKTAGGQTSGLSVTQVTTQDGKPLEVAVDDFQLSFTPKMVSE